MSRFVDLSHTVEHGLVTLKGLPAPVVCDFLSREESRQIYAPGTEFHIGRIDMVATAPPAGHRGVTGGRGGRGG
jgi:arylformamidase